MDALTGGPVINTLWGLSGDMPSPHDFDGDGRADAAIFRPATGEWFVRSSVEWHHDSTGSSVCRATARPRGDRETGRRIF